MNEPGQEQHACNHRRAAYLGAATLLLYASMFLATYEHHPAQAICVTVCLGISLRLWLRQLELRVEERLLLRLARQGDGKTARPPIPGKG